MQNIHFHSPKRFHFHVIFVNFISSHTQRNDQIIWIRNNPQSENFCATLCRIEAELDLRPTGNSLIKSDKWFFLTNARLFDSQLCFCIFTTLFYKNCKWAFGSSEWIESTILWFLYNKPFFPHCVWSFIVKFSERI